MLKPRKCRKLLLIITPQLKAAIGKKLYPINGKWAGDQFVQYLNATPAQRPQIGMVGRKLGTIYRRHMEKVFDGNRKVDWTMIQGRPDGETELPQRQTGKKALVDMLANRAQCGAFSKPPAEPVLTSQVRTDVAGITMKREWAIGTQPPVKEGELLGPELEIKGVQLRQSKLSSDEIKKMVAAFGEIAEQQLIDSFNNPEKVISPADEERMQEIGKCCMRRMIEALDK